MKKYLFSLDNTLCATTNNDYETSIPIYSTIDYLNKLQQEGNHITIWSDRETKTGICYTNFIVQQLERWNVKYDKLILYKPEYDVIVDVNSINLGN